MPLGGVAVVAAQHLGRHPGSEGAGDHLDAGPERRLRIEELQGKTSRPRCAPPASPAARRATSKPGSLAAARRISAEYYMPHLSHAQMEPVVAVAQVANGHVEVWAPTQSPQDARAAIAACLKVDIEKVTVHVTLLGGAFGRKSKPDFLCEAAWLAREVGAPVRVQWTREDDLQNSYYHSVAAHRLEAGTATARARSSPGAIASAYPAISRELRARHRRPRRRRAHQRRERHPVRDPQHEHRGLPRRRAHPHRLVPLGERHPPRLRHRLVRRRAGARRRQGSGGVPAGADRTRPQGGPLEGGARRPGEQLRRVVDRPSDGLGPRQGRAATRRRESPGGGARSRKAAAAASPCTGASSPTSRWSSRSR